MDLSFRYDWWFSRLPASPRDRGTVHACVLRPAEGERRLSEEIRVSPEGGIEGDRWIRDRHRKPGNQVSLINVHVLRSLAGDDARMPLSGDNLHVDLDLSEQNLPPGTLLTIGQAVLEVSTEPHRPCRHFHARYGAEGAKKVARANRVGKRGRGVLCQVVQAGAIRAGDRIDVRRPGASCL